MKFLINFASRSRPEKYHACIKNLRECFTDYKVLLKVDRDDPFVRDYFSTVYEELIIVLGYSKSKVDAINRGIHASNDVVHNWDILINTSDDIHWFKESGKVIEWIYSDWHDGFLHFPEPYAESQANKKKQPSISVVSIMDKIYYDRFGYVYDPSYNSIWCDNEATDVARQLGRYKFVNTQIFEHVHPAAGRAKKDELHIYNESFNARDKANYLKRSYNFK